MDASLVLRRNCRQTSLAGGVDMGDEARLVRDLVLVGCE